MDLPLLFGLIIAVGIGLYIILDGFDLGVGILFLWDREPHEQDTMMRSIAPFWDGNETWLILGGGAFYGVYPKAAAILFPALYIPIMVMLFSLIFRGVAFEFRFKADPHKRRIWDWAFCLGSTLAAFAQGIMLGTFIQGFQVQDEVFTGSILDWCNPFSLFTGAALVLGYALLGTTWLIMKTEGTLQQKAFHIAKPLAIVLGGAIAIVSLWTPYIDPAIAERWFTMSHFAALLPIPTVTLILAILLWRGLTQRRECLPFFTTIGLFLLAYFGLGVSMWPYVVPRHLTFWDASSTPETQLFMFVGVAIMVPIILAYTLYVFTVFKGKTSGETGYS